MHELAWREIARMQIIDRGWRTRVRVAFPAPDPVHWWLGALNRG